MAMISTTADRFLEATRSAEEGRGPDRATMKAALLVSVEGFRLSEESAIDNPYMKTGLPLDLARAAHQHEALAAKLKKVQAKKFAKKIAALRA